MLELLLSVLIWWRVHISFLVMPIAFWAIFLISYLKGADCGCFGSLSLFRQMSPMGELGHFLLLSGFFLGLFYLLEVKEELKSQTQTKPREVSSFSSSRHFGVTAIVLMLLAFVPWPISFSQNHNSSHDPAFFVDHNYLEAVISYRNAIIIDARPESEYEMGHLPEAINIPYDSDSEKLVDLINRHSLKKQTTIVYCSNAHCNAAELLAEKLHSLGCEKVRIYLRGWEDWVAHRSVQVSK